VRAREKERERARERERASERESETGEGERLGLVVAPHAGQGRGQRPHVAGARHLLQYLYIYI
jgi:hypothetical protein